MELQQITVRSMRGGAFSFGPYDIRVDRGSVLGNPYEMEKDESNRDRVCEAYKYWLFAHIKLWVNAKDSNIKLSKLQAIPPLALPQTTAKLFDTTGLRIAPAWDAPSIVKVEDEFTRLCYLATQHEINLVCWCFPKACHADVLRSALIWYHKTYVEECLKIETTITEFFG